MFYVHSSSIKSKQSLYVIIGKHQKKKEYKERKEKKKAPFFVWLGFLLRFVAHINAQVFCTSEKWVIDSVILASLNQWCWMPERV